MTLKELLKILNIDCDLPNGKITGIKTDSRKIKKGDIYIALKGKKYNGNKFAIDAINNGALISIVDDDIENDRCLKVDNTYDVLTKIGNYIRKKYNKPLIAITGSNGKTTTKELISYILKDKYNVLYNKENRNNIVGVSEILFKINKKIDIIITELGSNHIGEIKELSTMCEPNFCIITNIGSSHLQYFKTKKNIFKEKLSIKDGMKNGKMFVNGDDEYLKKIDCYKCGTHSNNDLIAYNIVNNKDSLTFNIKLDKEYKIIFHNPATHFVTDILLAIATCLEFMDIKDIIKRISKFKLIEKRMTILSRNNNLIINDCYNSSYESFEAGLNYLKKLSGKKIIIFGDILELGKYSKSIHKKINKIIPNDIDVLKIGKYSKYIKGTHFNSIDEIKKYLKENKITNSNIYIKGSRRMGLDEVVDFLSK